MTDKELKKMSRRELLELLLRQTKKSEGLEEKINALEKKLSDKILLVEEKGSLSEASVAICEILERTQQAADIYEINSKKMADDRAAEIMDNAAKKAETIVREAEDYLKHILDCLNKASVSCPELEKILQEEPAVEYENPAAQFDIGEIKEYQG